MTSGDSISYYGSPKLNNGDFPYWLIIELIDMYEATGDKNTDPWQAVIMAVSPKQAGAQKMADAWGAQGTGISVNKASDLMRAQALAEYGIGAQLWNEAGKSKTEMLRRAKKAAELIPTLFGFYMDKRMNGLGATGWDFIRGNYG